MIVLTTVENRMIGRHLGTGLWRLPAPPDRGSFLALKHLCKHVVHAEHLLPSWNLGSYTCHEQFQ